MLAHLKTYAFRVAAPYLSFILTFLTLSSSVEAQPRDLKPLNCEIDYHEDAGMFPRRVRFKLNSAGDLSGELFENGSEWKINFPAQEKSGSNSQIKEELMRSLEKAGLRKHLRPIPNGGTTTPVPPSQPIPEAPMDQGSERLEIHCSGNAGQFLHDSQAPTEPREQSARTKFKQTVKALLIQLIKKEAR